MNHERIYLQDEQPPEEALFSLEYLYGIQNDDFRSAELYRLEQKITRVAQTLFMLDWSAQNQHELVAVDGVRLSPEEFAEFKEGLHYKLLSAIGHAGVCQAMHSHRLDRTPNYVLFIPTIAPWDEKYRS